MWPLCVLQYCWKVLRIESYLIIGSPSCSWSIDHLQFGNDHFLGHYKLSFLEIIWGSFIYFSKNYLKDAPPEDATIPALNVVPNGTGIHESSGGVSPGTREGLMSLVMLQVREEENTLMRNWRGILLKGVVLVEDMKSSIWIATAYQPVLPVAWYVSTHVF